jgi:gas vesicle protein
MRFLLGFGVGVVLGIIFAPAPGGETRTRLAGKARELVHLPERKVQEKVQEVADASKARAGEIGSRVGRQAAEAAVQAVSDEMLNRGQKPA